MCHNIYKGVILLPCVILKNSARSSVAFLRILELQVLYASLKNEKECYKIKIYFCRCVRCVLFFPTYMYLSFLPPFLQPSFQFSFLLPPSPTQLCVGYSKLCSLGNMCPEFIPDPLHMLSLLSSNSQPTVTFL